MRNLFTAWVVYQYEVINMHLKGWPFEPLDGDDINPCGEGSGGGGFPG
jgi:hypothetical protein